MRTIHLSFYDRNSESQSRTALLLANLTDEDQRVFRKISDPERKQQSMLSRGFLRECLKPFFTKGEVPRFLTSSLGKPMLPEGNVSFSVSHSQQMVSIAVAEGFEIGLDIQFADRFTEKLWTRIMINPEKNLPEKERKDLFFKHWTIKEAAMKCAGLGLSYGFQNIEINTQTKTLRLRKKTEFISRFPIESLSLSWESGVMTLGSSNGIDRKLFWAVCYSSKDPVQVRVT